MHRIVLGDNLVVLSKYSDELFNLIYIDPPFNTGVKQSRVRKPPPISQDIFQENVTLSSPHYEDSFDDFKSFILPRMKEAYRLLTKTGSLFFHIDYREVHYCKVWLDEIFGRESFKNEIIWAYDYGARSKKKWSTKHDNILWYTKDPDNYTFNYDEIDRIPYMAPGLVGPEKAAKGKTVPDVWWHTIVSPNAKSKTGYPTQKPLPIINRIIKVHSKKGDTVADFFAGSGTLGLSAAQNDRDFLLIDNNPEAIAIMRERLSYYEPEYMEMK